MSDYTLNYYAKDLFGNTEVVKTINFLLTERPETYTGNISGYMYDDSNKNGIQDEGEKFMAGWKVCIDLNNNNTCEENIEPFNVTNNKGYYEFSSLATGTYNLIISGGNYSLNIENIQTFKGHIDEFISKEDSIEINFDDSKKGNYNIMMDNFDYKNGSIYYSGVLSVGDIQKYIINWDGVSNDIENSVKYTISGNIVEIKSNNSNFINNDSYIYKILLGIIILVLFIIGFIFYLKKINKKD